MTTCSRADVGAWFNYTFLTGYERDTETGLDYAQARYYSSGQGRFTSADPLLASGVPINPKTWNRYAYVLNNPLKLIDPSGMSAERPSPEDSSVDLHHGGAGGMYAGFDAPREWIATTQEEAVEATTAEVGSQSSGVGLEIPTRRTKNINRSYLTYSQCHGS